MTYYRPSRRPWQIGVSAAVWGLASIVSLLCIAHMEVQGSKTGTTVVQQCAAAGMTCAYLIFVYIVARAVTNVVLD